MEKNNALVVGLIVAAVILSLVTLFAVLGNNNKVDEEALANKVTAQVISQMPKSEKIDVDKLATEVAGKISVPEVTVPEFKSDEKVQDLWEDLYADEIDGLETEAYDVAVSELEDHDYKALEKYLEANVEGFDELENVDVKDYEIKVINLGLDEDEDKVAVVEFELKVKYSLLEGADDDFKKTVYANATVTFDEGDFSDEDVELVFA